MSEERLLLLRGMPIFGGLKDETIRFILQSSDIKIVNTGEYFFKESESASSLFVLELGKISVFRKWQNKDYPLRQLGPGDCFGEMAIMQISNRSASVQAIEDCYAIEISTQSLYQILKKFPEQYAMIQMNMGREVCRRLYDTEQRLFENQIGGLPLQAMQLYCIV